MADLALSVFALRNDRGFLAPPLSIEFHETEASVTWFVHAGGSLLYVSRIEEGSTGSVDLAAETFYMARRVTTALMMGGAGLYRAELTGRYLLAGVSGDFQLSHAMNTFGPDGAADRVLDWFKASTDDTTIKRATDDAYLALDNPHEAFLFIYRGFEWIVKRDGVGWDQLASEIGTSSKNMRELKQMANDETGVRHASRLGGKLRPDTEIYGTWVAGLIDAISASRARRSSDFTRMTAEEIVEVVTMAIGRPFS